MIAYATGRTSSGQAVKINSCMLCPTMSDQLGNREAKVLTMIGLTINMSTSALNLC